MRTLSLQIFKELPVTYLKKIALLFKCSYVIKKNPNKQKTTRCEIPWPLEDLFMTGTVPSSKEFVSYSKDSYIQDSKVP